MLNPVGENRPSQSAFLTVVVWDAVGERIDRARKRITVGKGFRVYWYPLSVRIQRRWKQFSAEDHELLKGWNAMRGWPLQFIKLQAVSSAIMPGIICSYGAMRFMTRARWV
jgi:hypothetical protein